MSSPGDSPAVEPDAPRWPRWLPFAILAVIAGAVAIIIVVASGGDDSTTNGTTTGTTGAAAQSVPATGSAVTADTAASASSSPSSAPSTGAVATTPSGTTPATTGSTAPTVTTTPAPTRIDLGSLAAFAVLGNTAVNSAGSTVVTGQVGASNGEVTGFPSPDSPDAVVVDSAAAADAQITVANVAAALDARERTALLTPVLAEQTLGPGTYGAATLGVAGTVTLDAGGDPNAVFVFESDSSLTVSPGSQIVLEGGAQACNVYWRIDSANLGSGATLVGTVIANNSIGASGGADISGRLIAISGAVLLDSASVAVPTCT